MGVVLAFTLVLVHWVLVSPLVLLVLRVGFLPLSLRCGGLALYGFVSGLAFAAVNWVYSIECVRVCCQ